MDDTLAFSDFIDELASGSPTPGGGGASAAVGALACALVQMFANLTLGKAAYAQVEEEVFEACSTLGRECREMLRLVDEDAAAFQPLAQAYAIPKDDPERSQAMEEALLRACEPPLFVMELAVRVIAQLGRLSEIGARGAVSDAGAALAFARAALEGASLNVYINCRSMGDRTKADEMCERADELLDVGVSRSREAFEGIARSLRGR